MKNFRKFEIRISKTLKFRFVCKHWYICFDFQCLFTFFWCKHTLFWKIFENLQSEFRKFWNIALFANAGLFWFPMFIYIFLIVCFGFQCLFTFFWCKHNLFWKIFENLKSEIRELWNFALFGDIGLFILVSNVYLHFFDCLFWFPMFVYIFLM